MLKVKSLDYIDINDVCELFDRNIRDFSFTEDCENGTFYYLLCSGDWIQDTKDCMEDVEGTCYAKRYYNTMKLQEYIRDEMKLDGIHIHMHW